MAVLTATSKMYQRREKYLEILFRLSGFRLSAAAVGFPVVVLAPFCYYFFNELKTFLRCTVIASIELCRMHFPSCSPLTGIHLGIVKRCFLLFATLCSTSALFEMTQRDRITFSYISIRIVEAPPLRSI